MSRAPILRKTTSGSLRVRLLLAGTLLLGASAPTTAQPRAERITPPDADLLRSSQPDQPPGAVFLSSAILPGSGQYLLGDDRWVAYAALELWGLVSYVQRHRNARELEQRYRDFAWLLPRRVSLGERRDSIFQYYETMTQYPASGAYDVDPNAPGIQPERQLGTFNGDLWALALALNGGDAATPGTDAYDRALAYYLGRAIPPAYYWAWAASPLEQQLFVDLIRESDDAFRSATRYLGLILANHLVSAVDALITARLRQLGAEGLRFELGGVREGAAGVRWEYVVRYRF